MMTLKNKSAKQILEKIKKEIKKENYPVDEFIRNLLEGEYNPDLISCKIKVVASVGGIEGDSGEEDGKEVLRIIEVTDKKTNEKIFISLEGYYSHWGWAEWKDLEYSTLVEPYTKTIVAYKTIK